MGVKDLGVKELANHLVDELYATQNARVLANLSKHKFDELFVSKDQLLEHIRKQLAEYVNADGTELTSKQKEEVLLQVRKEMWGYGIIDELIHDKDISDIKLHGYDSIRVKKKGKRFDSGITFDSPDNYINFVTRLLEKNRVNLGTANAIQTFTDSTQEDFILRITAVSGLLTDSGVTCIVIRKVPKDKYDFKELEEAGMFSMPSKAKREEQAQYKKIVEANKVLNKLIAKMVSSRGIIFTGKGASGKTTLMNAFISLIPHDEAIMICQENSELFDNEHPDILSAHVMINSGDSKICYTLGDLTRAALLVDMDRVIVGEVKEGQEAAGLSKASMTGHKCWTSVHGEDCAMAIEKMADYISQATGYTLEEALRQLIGFEYVVHLKDYKIDEIVRIDGWDKDARKLVITQVYPIGGGIEICEK